MPDPTLNLSDSLNNWLDSVAIVEQINLSLSDNLNSWADTTSKTLNFLKALTDTESANWLDSGGPVEGVRLTQLPVEILASPQGKIELTQLPVEILLPSADKQLQLSDTMTLTDSLAKTLLGLRSLTLTDTMTLSDSLRIGYGLLISDSLTLSDSLVKNVTAVLTLTLSDNMNGWQDLFQYSLLATLSLVLSDNGGANWTDLVQTDLRAFLALTLSVSDTLNFWQDPGSTPDVPFFTMIIAPRSAPTGDPSDNCCPPVVWISS